MMLKDLTRLGWVMVASAAFAWAQTTTEVKQSPEQPAKSPAVGKPKPDVIPPVHSVKALKAYIEQVEKKAEEASKAKGGQETDKKEDGIIDKEELGLDYLESLLFHMELRAYPNDSVDWEAYGRAMDHRDAMDASDFTPAALNRWTFVGPTGMTVPYRIYYGQGNINGRVNALAYHPTTPGVYFVGAAEGGLWKTTDYGVNWTPLTDNWPNLHVSCIAIHPTNPNIIYVGTGDFHGSRGYPIGIMKTTDGGATWTNLGRIQFSGLMVSAILLDPENPDIVTVTTGRGSTYWGYVWRSTNGGSTWSTVINTQAAWNHVTAGALNTSNGTRYYYATGHDYNGGQVWRSSNRGQTWTKLTTPMTNASNVFQNAIEIAPSPTAPDTVYLMSGYDRRIWKSTNAGGNWTDTTNNFPNGNNNYNWSQAWYDIHMYVSTRTVSGSPVDVIYVGLIDIVQSYDGGATWRSLGQTYTNSALTHNDQHSFAINPLNPNETLVGNDGGIYRLTYNPSTHAYSFTTSLNRNLGITQFYHADFHPTNATRMIGGTQDNASPASTGDLNNWRSVGGGDGGGCAINPSNPNIQYATSQYLGMYRTTNNWSSSSGFSPSWGSDRRPFIGTIAINPSQPNYLYAGTNYLWRWNESTQSWSARLGSQELSVEGSVIAIAAAPSDANRIYTGSNRGEVWMSTNGGTSWTQINTGSPGLPNRAITSIAVHPTNPSKIYLTLGSSGTPHVYRCDNTLAGTRVWTNISGSGTTGLPDIHTNTIAVDPANPDSVLYVGNDVGFFYTANGGGKWFNGTAPRGLPNVSVRTVKVTPGTARVNLATYGRGMWQINTPLVVAGDVNGDGCVNDADLLTVLFAFGATGNRLEDLDNNNVVNDNDVLIVLFNFGTGC